MKIGEMLNVGEYPKDNGDQLSSGWIEPLHKRWIIFFSRDGSAQLYTKREESGAVIGDPIEL